METVFPTADGLKTFFLTSYRMTGGVIEQTGTVIVKRTYDVNTATGELTPAADALPVFDSDQMREAPQEELIQYEHDLAAYKPGGDLIVSGFQGTPGALQRVRVGGVLWLSRTLLNPIPPEDADLFGWEPRVDSGRADEGNFPTDPDDYPLPNPLPSGFNNLFYNGYLRAAAQISPLPHFSGGSEIAIERNGSVEYEVTLETEAVSATYFTYSGSGPDVGKRWQPQGVTINLDTVVITPSDNQCYVVWRGVWPYADHPESAYRRLVVEVLE